MGIGRYYFLILLLVPILFSFSIPSAFAQTVSAPTGSGVPGCEGTDECFIPSTITVDVGATVTWVNDDTAAHTVTSGSSADGPDGNFDSSLFMAGSTFSVTFDSAGEYPYFCMVHPWMAGTVIVGDGSSPRPSTTLDVEILIITGQARVGESLKINVVFTDDRGNSVEHVNYDIRATQRTDTILDERGVHDHDGRMTHTTSPLQNNKAVQITVTFLGFGIDPPFTGPMGEKATLFVGVEPGFVPPIIPPAPSVSTTKVKVMPGSSVPGCEEINRCYQPYSITVKTGAKVTWTNVDSAAHTVTSGTSVDGPDGHFDSSLFMAGQSFSVTFDQDGTFDYFCMVHPWMTGIVVVGEGGTSPISPPRHESVDLEVLTDQRIYDLGDMVQVGVILEDTTKTHRVAIDVADPTGTSVVSRTVIVSPDSTEQIQFRISDDFKTGSYRVAATTQVDGKIIKDKTFFKVKSQFNQFRIVSVEVTNQQGNPSTLQKGNIGFIKVLLDSNKQITTLITINLFDSELTSIGIGSVKSTLTSGTSEIIISFLIPSDTASGDVEIFVNAFSDWPSNGGIPLTNEFSIIETIGNGNQPPPSNPPPSNPPPSNPPPSIEEAIVVTTDKTSYSEGDIIIISGEVKDILGQAVSVVIISPNGSIVSIAQVQVEADKRFSVEMVAGATMKSDGTYTVKVTYAGPNRTAETTFEFGATGVIGTTPSGQSLSVEGFGIGYQITGGNIISITPDVDQGSLIIEIEAVDDGELTITLPRELIDAKIGSDDDDFLVLVDAEEVDFDETKTNSERTLTIRFSAGTEEIEIIGTFVI